MKMKFCIGNNCPLKKSCSRFVEKATVFTFIIPPYDKEKKKCAYYWVDIN